MSIIKLLKLPVLFEYDRKELIGELNYLKYQRKYKTNDCPICGRQLYSNSWSEEHWGVVETVTRCGRDAFNDTHYSDHFSYGETNLIAGKYEFGYRHNTPWKEIDRIRAEWMLATSKFKKERSRIKRLEYRKRKSQARRTRK